MCWASPWPRPPRLLARALEHRTPDSFYILTGDVVAWYMGFTPVSAGMLAKPALLYGFDLDIAGRLCRAYLQAGRAWREPILTFCPSCCKRLTILRPVLPVPPVTKMLLVIFYGFKYFVN